MVTSGMTILANPFIQAALMLTGVIFFLTLTVVYIALHKARNSPEVNTPQEVDYAQIINDPEMIAYNKFKAEWDLTDSELLVLNRTHKLYEAPDKHV